LNFYSLNQTNDNNIQLKYLKTIEIILTYEKLTS